MKRAIPLLLVTLGLLTGCSNKIALDPDADKNVGEKALQTALEAWKSGKSQAELKNGSPSIIFNEDDWRNGKQLLEFKMNESVMSGRQVKHVVEIKLKDKDGNTVDKKATYVIDTIPQIVIVRDSFASS